MSVRKQKRFWTDATVAPVGDGFTVELDGRRLKTPAKAPLAVPTRAMADMIAREWAGQSEHIDPLTMPATRSANAAIDKVAIQHAEVADMLAAYGDTDLLCYRAESPASLVRRQSDLWDPALDWAAATLGVRLTPTAGVMHVAQTTDHLNRLSSLVHELSDFQLAAFHDLVSLSGSLILGFATARKWRPAEDIWTLSRLDDLWQQEQWGDDEEATRLAEIKRQAFLHSGHFFAVC